MKKFIACLLWLSISLQSGHLLAESMVWKAEKNGQTVYLGGTIHLLRASDFPLPTAFEKAYKKADILAFEIDDRQLNSPETANKMMAMLNYQDNRNLQNVVEPDTFREISQYAKSLGLPLEPYLKAKPGFLLSIFTILELQKIGVTQEGVDSYFAERGRRDGKGAFFLETVEQQMSFLSQLGKNNEDAFYRNLIREMKMTSQQFLPMLKSWREGDQDTFRQMMIDPMAKDFPAMYQSLLVQRNNQWMPKVESYFATPQIEFVLVGSAHLVGEDGVVEQLKKKGYKLTEL